MASIPNGLPVLSPAQAALFKTPSPLSSDTVSATVAAGTPKWGIYDSAGNLVLEQDNTVSFEFKQNWRLPDYPQEQGGFQTYNKVARPYEVRFVFSKGGSVAERSDFLQTLTQISASLDLYSAVTPEITYSSANVEMYGYRRTAVNGVTLIRVEIGLKQINQTATASFSNTAQPQGANQTNLGSAQPTTTPAQTQSAISSILSSGGS